MSNKRNLSSKQSSTNKKKPAVARSKSSSTKRTGKSRTVAQTKERNMQRKQASAIILFALALLMLAIALIPGESIWSAIRSGLIGVFGWMGAILVPIGIIYIAVLCALDKPGRFIAVRSWEMAGIIVFLSAVIFTFMSSRYTGDFFDNIGIVFRDAVSSFNSGILGTIFGSPVIALAGKTGASIIFILLLFVLIMLSTGTTLISFFKAAWKPVEKSTEKVRETRLRHQYNKEHEQNIPSYQSRKTKRIDIPVDDEFKTQENNKQHMDKNKENIYPMQKRKRAFFDIPLDDEPDYEELKKVSGIVTNMPRGQQEPELENDERDPGTAPPSIGPFGKLGDRAADISLKNNESDSDNTQTVQDDITEEKTNSSDSANIEHLINQVTLEQINNKKKKQPIEPGLDNEPDLSIEKREYIRPPITMFKQAAEVNQEDVQEELKQNADKLVNTLRSFGIETRIVGISRGPSVTRYELQPAAGVKISRITSLADDLALGLAAISIRIEAPIPGRSAIGVEIPNHVRSDVSLREVLESPEFRRATSKVTVALGRDITGKVVVTDLAKMPHLLIAGTTGSGKSVTVQCMIQSVLYNSTPDEVKILLIDPKRVEFKAYNGIPNLLVPVVTEPRKAAGALGWAVTEMLKRYNIFADNNVRDIYDYNELAKQDDEIEPMPQILIIVDEFSDLMMAAKNEVEDYVCRLAQMARAAGMHLVIATQRPSTDVITGLIKANIPSRLALSVSNNTDSRVILDSGGAEILLGHGDMLFSPIGASKPVRIQGCYVSIKEINEVTNFLRKQQKEDYDESVMDEIEKQAVAEKSMQDSDEPQDELLPQAIEIVVDVGEASATLLQRRLRLGYARAGRLVDTMERMGIVGPHEGSKPRKVLISRQEWLEMKMNKAE